ncbi:MAG: adenylate/guanylate cyclase domain-containing protein [Sterolibacterium sp.]|nr:adenylate/guanylate cyclase domain-containing protein [Sterolibacterium sp.]
MKKNLLRYGVGLLLMLTVLGHALHFYSLEIVSRLDAILYDSKLRMTMPRSIDDRVVILDIDEKSLAEIGRWPWNRAQMAALMGQLFEHYQIRLVGFDVVFAEPDDSSGMGQLDALSRKELRADREFLSAYRSLRPGLDYDARFAQALRGRPVILGYYLSNRADDPGSGALPTPVLAAGQLEQTGSGGVSLTHWSSFGGNLPLFQKNAAGAGHFNPIVDFDGIVRRVPMLAEYHGNYYESLSLAMVRAYLGFPEVVPGFPATGAGDLEWLDMAAPLGILRIPVDESAAALIPYRGYEGSFPYFSMADVLKGRVPLERLQGRIALVGTSAPGLKDQRATPVGEAYSGVEMHANLIAGMLDGQLKLKPSYALAVDFLQLLVAGLLMIFLLPRLSPMRASLLALLIFLLLGGINLAAWQYANFVLPIAAALTLVVSLFALNMSWGYFVESRSKRQMTGLFGQYLPPELVEEMSRDPENYSMAGRKAELTVLFSDVRGFTTISEGLGPDELANLMNEYLGAMTQIIRHRRGTLDKYIGDAIMAFWGAPVEDADHAKHAVLSAIEMQQALPALNRVLAQKGWPELKIGVGVNTGVMTVGDMGSPVRQSYTVMGDAVNLGSRLEGITKQYGVGILVGEHTWAQLQGVMAFREIDRVRVKGKAEPVGIYEPLCELTQAPAEMLAELARWDQALTDYRAQHWHEAEQGLQALSALTTPPRYIYTLYLERIAHLREHPPGETWDGVTIFETK